MKQPQPPNTIFQVRRLAPPRWRSAEAWRPRLPGQERHVRRNGRSVPHREKRAARSPISPLATRREEARLSEGRTEGRAKRVVNLTRKEKD